MGEQSSVLFEARQYSSPKYWPMWIILGLLRLATLLPYRGLIFVGRLVGRTIFLVADSRKRIVDTNLARCFPQMRQTERDRIKSACFLNMGVSLMEMAICWWWSAQKLEKIVEIEGREHVDAALARGQGVILLTGHFTSLEIGARLLALYMPVQVMYRTQRNPLYDSYLYTRRSSYFVNAVSRKDTRQLIKGIKNLVPTWYAPDQDFRQEKNAFAPFMGIPTATITASSRLAQSSGAVVLPYYPERRADGRGYILRIDAPLANFPSGDDFEDASAVNRSIEKYARLHPENYMWVHQRFKTRPPGEAPFYS